MESLGSPPKSPSAATQSTSKKRNHSVMGQLSNRNRRVTQHHAAKAFEEMVNMERNTIGFVKGVNDKVRELEKFIVEEGQRLHQRCRDWKNRLYSLHAQQTYTRSAKLEQHRETQRKEETTTQQRYLNREAKKTNDDVDQIMEEIVLDKEAQALEQAQDTIDLSNTDGNDVDDTIFGSSPVAFTSSVQYTSTGSAVLNITSGGKKGFSRKQRIALAKIIVEKNLSKHGGGKKGKSPETKYVEEIETTLTRKNYKGVSAKSIKKWLAEFETTGTVTSGPNGGAAALASDKYLNEALDFVKKRHMEQNAYRLDNLDGLILTAMIKTAKDAGRPPPVSTKDVAPSTMKKYIKILSPFLIETNNAQDKATTETRSAHGADLRFILCQGAAIGAVKFGPIGLMNKRTGEKNQCKDGLMVNIDFTGYTLKNINGKMTIVVTLYEDKDKAPAANAVSKGFEQSIKWLGVGCADGDDGGDVFCWRHIKNNEIKGGISKPIYKLKLPFNGHTCHFWLVRKDSSMQDFNKQLIEEFVFPLLIKIRIDTCFLEEGDELTQKEHRMLLSFDGEGIFLQQMVEFMKKPKWKNALIHAVKGSPGCTGQRGGNSMDNCPSFKNSKKGHSTWSSSSHMSKAHKEVFKDTGETEVIVHDPDVNYETSRICRKLSIELKEEGLSLGHITDIKKFFFRMVTIYAESFTKAKLSLGWQLNGYAPWEPKLFLSACQGYQDLTTDKKKWIRETILPLMVERMARDGECTDAFMDQLKVPAGIYGNGHVVTQPFDEKRALNQRRGMIVSHPVQEEKRQRVLGEAALARLERIETSRPLFLQLKQLIKDDQSDVILTPATTTAALMKMGTIILFQGVLELLDTPEDLFLNGPRTKVRLQKGVLVDLVKAKVLEAVAIEAAAVVAEEVAQNEQQEVEGEVEENYSDDGFISEEDGDSEV